MYSHGFRHVQRLWMNCVIDYFQIFVTGVSSTISHYGEKAWLSIIHCLLLIPFHHLSNRFCKLTTSFVI